MSIATIIAIVVGAAAAVTAAAATARPQVQPVRVKARKGKRT